MTQPQHCSYTDLCREVAAELQAAADAACAAGVPAWQIMLDPGVGFAKVAADSAKLVTAWPHIATHLQGAGFVRAELLCMPSTRVLQLCRVGGFLFKYAVLLR